jgi:hypothetical protein
LSGSKGASDVFIGKGVADGDTIQAIQQRVNDPLSYGGDGDPSNEAAANLSHLKSESAAHEKKTKREGRDKRGHKVQEGQGKEGAQKVGGKDDVEQTSRRQLRRFNPERFKKTTEERASRLFPDSLPEYEQGVLSLDALPLGTNGTGALRVVQNPPRDVAEQHNILESARAIWSGELADCQSQLEESKTAGTQPELEARIRELKEKIQMADQAIGHLMDVHGSRIEDTYQMAPQICECCKQAVEASPEARDLLLRPKDLSELILDQILSLQGDRKAIFDVLLMKGLVRESLDPIGK